MEATSTSNLASIPTVDRFIFVSESCLPVVTMQELDSALFHGDDNESDKAAATRSAKTNSSYDGSNANKSWINARNTPNNGYARQLQWDAMDPAIPQANVWKADQWIVLTRHHAWPILSLVDEAAQSVQQNGNRSTSSGGNPNRLQLALWQCFRGVKASDEMYFPTVMSLLGILADGDDVKDNPTKTSGSLTTTTTAAAMSKEVARKRVTYCDWSMNAKNPASFIISRKEKFKELKRVMRLAREEGCIFARKFTLENTNGANTIGASGDGNEGLGHAQEFAITGDEWIEIVSKMSGSNYV